MPTHYIAHKPKDSVCGVRKPIHCTTNVAEVTCPSCLAWIDKNLKIRIKQIASKPASGFGSPEYYKKPGDGNA